MKFKFVLAALIALPFALTACSKQENAPASEQVAVSSAATTESETISAEQKAAIDALDQPVLDEKNTDWNMVGTLYNFISDRVSELKQKLQVIIVDHANFKNECCRNSVIEDWWNENNLIPEDWYKK